MDIDNLGITVFHMDGVSREICDKLWECACTAAQKYPKENRIHFSTDIEANLSGTKTDSIIKHYAMTVYVKTIYEAQYAVEVLIVETERHGYYELVKVLKDGE